VAQAPVDRVAQAPVDRVAQAPAVRAAPAVRVIRVAPGDTNRVVATEDMNRVMATEATDRADTTPATPVAQVGRAAMTRVVPADLASPGDTIPADLVTPEGAIPGVPEVTTREHPGAPSRAVQRRANLAMPAATIPVGRALMGRMPRRRDLMPVRRPPTAGPLLQMRALLRRTPVERQTLAGHRWDHQTPVAVATPREALTRAAATRPADRTLRLEAVRPVGAIPKKQ
jgi:hypothetical protein